MPNQITALGLETKTQAELVAELTAAYQSIYGPDIDLSQNSPDGQMMMIFIQAILDNEDLLTQIYNSFDPDKAFGVVLDTRVAYNGIQRQAGVPTVTDITIVTSQALTLKGLNDFPDDPYTVADNAGNQFQLQETQNPGGAGTFVYSFQAKDPGAFNTIPNTITVPVTIVLGVVSINNPTTYTTLGINEETDAVLKIRRQKSVSIASQGYLAGLLALLENINGVTAAFVYENNTSFVDGDGTEGHTIWVIVGGSADPAEIANAIYKKRNAGAGMRGNVEYIVTQVDGSPFTVRWDDVVPEPLYIRFTATSLDGINPVNVDLIRTTLPSTFTPGVYEQVDINVLATKVQAIDPNALVTNAGFSTSPTGPFTNTLQPTSKDQQFAVSAANIIILPVLVLPQTATADTGGDTVQFTAYGGFGAYTWSIDSGPGSVDSSGLYTSAGAGVAVVRATDTQGNFGTASVTVT